MQQTDSKDLTLNYIKDNTESATVTRTTIKIHFFNKAFSRSNLESLLSIVNCSIVSTTRNSQVDAYVLSESSMFISKRR